MFFCFEFVNATCIEFKMALSRENTPTGAALSDATRLDLFYEY